MKYELDELLKDAYGGEGKKPQNGFDIKSVEFANAQHSDQNRKLGIGKYTKVAIVSVCVMILIVALVPIGVKLNSLVGGKKEKEEYGESAEKTKLDATYISEISVLACNNTWKYTEEDIGCEVYEWSEDVVLPIPKPENSTGIEYVGDGFYLLGVDKEEWEEYIYPLVNKYDGYISYDSIVSENDSCFARIVDMEYNYMANIVWGKDFSYYNLRNNVGAFVYVGSKEKNTSLTNQEVMELALEELGIEDKKGFGALNISSKGNLSDGFDVYIILPSQSYIEENEDNPSSFLCVLDSNDEIVLVQPEGISIGSGNSSLEFVKTETGWNMYTVNTLYGSGTACHELSLYVMENGKFTCSNAQTVYGIEGLERVSAITLKKNNDVIDVYKLDYNRDEASNEKEPFSQWLLGAKVGIIDENGISIDAIEKETEVRVEEETYENNNDVSEPTLEDYVEEQKKNSNVTFRFENDTLYVSGKGCVLESDKDKWKEYIHDVEKIVIEDGITVIGYRAFDDMYYLESVEIASSVKVIEGEAFIMCSNLNYIQLSEGLEKIGGQAFYHCGLLTLDIPDSVKEIGMAAFAGCVDMDNFEIPDGVEIGTNAFLHTKMLNDMVAETGLAIIDGVLYDGTLAKGDVVIPDSVTKIAKYAFYYNDEMTSVEIPASVVCIEDAAFESCKKLETVKCMSIIENIGTSVFRDCDKLENVELAEGMTTISYGMFANCGKLRSIDIPKSVEKIEGSAFSECVNLENIDLSGNVRSVGSDAFGGCIKLAFVKFSGNIESVGLMAFSRCDNLITIYGVNNTYAETLALQMDCEFLGE